jgi:nitroreductase
MHERTKVRPFGGLAYEKEDLMKMDPELLRALLRERVHHNIEVPFYPLIQKWNGDPKPSFGLQAQMVFDVWKERGFTENDPDVQWAKEYLELAGKIRAGEKIEWNKPLPEPFADKEMEVVNKLIYERRSIRDWIDKPVPDEMIEKILKAGRAAPIGCNLDEVRFIVLKDPKEIEMIWSDISTKNAIIIVVCYDTRIPKIVAQDKFVPHNAGFDAAAAADHMLLIAHALGLGAVWLSKTVESEKTKDTGKEFKERYGLPDYIEVALHIAVGWPAMGTIKTQRMPLSNMIISRDSFKEKTEN